MESAALELRLFGSPAAWVSGNPLPPLRSRKGLWLLSLLALRQNRPLEREWLAGTLWPDSESGQAFYNLRQSLTNLRHALGPAADCLLAPTRHTLCLDTVRVWADVIAFDDAIKAGTLDALKQVVTLYRGPLLEGCAEEWANAERVVREQQYLDALGRLADDALARQQPASAVGYLRLLTAADPYRESAHCALMQGLADCGDFAAVTQTYRDLRLRLHRELHAACAPETDALYHRLQEQSRQTSRLANTPREDSSLPPRRLPVPLTRLIGREREVEEVAARLQTNRLVTLTGAGGIGKTRLSLAVGEALAANFEGGAWFVELAALSNPDHLLPTVAQTLGLREKSPSALLTALTTALNARSLLLILDNCEHLRDACAGLAHTLLAACSSLRLLVSSRQPLGIMGEHVYRVPSLASPPATWSESKADLTMLAQYPGLLLFVERAQLWQPDFRITSENACAVVGIARQLDGIPLAIELAASRLRSLSVQEVQERLKHRFDLLTGNNTALPRHRTLRALIDWSHDLLTEAEQTLLRRLSVFVGGWTLPGAEFVGAGDNIAEGDVLDLLTSLADRSLLIADTQQSPTRYRMLETIRQYADAKLRESSDYVRTRRRHCEFFLELVEICQATDTAETFACLETEYNNLRAALAWCRDDPAESDTEFRLTVGLYTFWYLRGPLREAREHLLRAATHAENTRQTAWQARILMFVGALARLQGELDAAREVLEQALALAQTVADTKMESSILTLLGSLSLSAGDYANALPLFEQGLRVARSGGHRHAESECLVWLGDAARWRGDYASAQAFYEQGLAVGQTLEFGWHVASAEGMLGELALLRSELREAGRLVAVAFRGFLAIGDRTSCAFILCTAAGIATASDNLERAACLLGMVASLLRTLQTPLPGPDHDRYAERLRAVETAMEAEAFTRALQAGEKAEWEQVVAFVLNPDLRLLSAPS